MHLSMNLASWRIRQGIEFKHLANCQVFTFYLILIDMVVSLKKLVPLLKSPQIHVIGDRIFYTI